MLVGAVADPVDEVDRLLGEAGPEQGRDRVRRIPQPAVAVIPVPSAARILGQGRGGRRGQRSAGRVGQQLDHQRRPADSVLQRAVIAALGDPVGPVLRGSGQQAGGIAAARELAPQGKVALAIAQGEPGPLAGFQPEPKRIAGPAAGLGDGAALGQRGGEDHFLRAARGQHQAVSLDIGASPPRVVGGNVEHAVDLDRPLAGLHASTDPAQRHEAIALQEAGHEVGDHQRPLGPLKGGGQDVGIRQIGLLARRHGIGRSQAERAAPVPVEQRRKDGG